MTSNPRTVAIVQARMSSTRLPGKIMADLGGKPLLQRVLERAHRARLPDLVVVATTVSPADQAVAAFCERTATPCFRGSEEDVLDRYYWAAQQFEADTVVRLTADCPLLDPEVMDHVITAFRSGDWDYASNTLEPTYPDGLDTEVFKRPALERAWCEATLASEREHVTPYLWKHPNLFRLLGVRNDTDLSGLRWTVDKPEDLALAREIYRHLATMPEFGMSEVLDLFHRYPELKNINAGMERNEGYQTSIGMDTISKGAAS